MVKAIGIFALWLLVMLIASAIWGAFVYVVLNWGFAYELSYLRSCAIGLGSVVVFSELRRKRGD